MKKISLLLLLVVSLTAYAQTYTTGTVTLSSTAGLAMTVKLDISTNVSLTLTGPSTRWFAVGFNASSMAAGTDVVGVHSAGALTAFDANLTGYSAPATDVQQNWTITSDQVAGGVRTVIATRALSTGDPNDYTFTAAAGTLSLIWARANTNSFNYAYHGNTNRGITTATLTLVPVTPPPTGSANQTYCSGATVSQLVASGTNIQWYANATGGSPLAGGTPLVNGTTYYATQTVGGLESQTRLAVTVSIINSPSQAPVFVNPPASVCSNVNSITFNVTNVNGATSYLWFNQVGQGITTQPTITYPLSPGMTSMNISVNAANQCGQGPSVSHTVLINTAYNSSIQQTACDTFVWNNQAYTSSGSYTYQGTTTAGCDSIVTLQLVVLNGITTNVQVAQCTPLTLNGQTYNQSGTYQQILPSNLGCDSILNIQFTLTQGDTVLVALSSCDSVSIGGQTYTNSGIVPELLTNVNGCDSLVLWDVVIYQSVPLTVFDTTVTSSFSWNGQVYTSSGSYTQQLSTSQGCDSVVTVNLTISTGGIVENEFKSPFPTVLHRGGEVLLPNGNWILVDMNGRELWKGTLADTRLRLDVVPGLYVIRSERRAVKIIVIE